MKACVLQEIGRLVYKDVPDPVPGNGEVLLKIQASGICGSDITRVFNKGTYSFPTIPGHEFSGKIIDIGPGVNSSFINKSAAVFPLLPCKSCDMCEIGEYSSCRNYSYFGSRCDGGFAEYIVVPAWNLIINDELSYEELAMAEPAAVSFHALSRAGLSLGDSIAIFGAGAIGLILAAFASISGAGKIILLDIDEKRLTFAKQLGYIHVLNSGSDTWLKELMSITKGRGVDLAIEGAGVAAAAEGCFQSAKPLGRVVLMGNPIGDIQLRQDAYWEILRKQLTVYGTWNSSFTQKQNDWHTAINAMASKRLDLTPLITHRFPLNACTEAFNILKDKSQFSCRIMFIPDKSQKEFYK